MILSQYGPEQETSCLKKKGKWLSIKLQTTSCDLVYVTRHYICTHMVLINYKFAMATVKMEWNQLKLLATNNKNMMHRIAIHMKLSKNTTSCHLQNFRKTSSESSIVGLLEILKQRFQKLKSSSAARLSTGSFTTSTMFSLLNSRFSLGIFFHSLMCLTCWKMW